MLSKSIEHSIQGPSYQRGCSQKAAIGKYDELLTMVKKQKLKEFCQRSLGLAKTIQQDIEIGKIS